MQTMHAMGETLSPALAALPSLAALPASTHERVLPRSVAGS